MESPTFIEDLQRATSDKVDRFLDIAAGKILDDVTLRMNVHGVICCCGAVSAMENTTSQSLPKNYLYFMMNHLTIKAYTVLDFADQFDRSTKALQEAVDSGRMALENVETIVNISDKVEEMPRIWASLFDDANTMNEIGLLVLMSV